MADSEFACSHLLRGEVIPYSMETRRSCRRHDALARGRSDHDRHHRRLGAIVGVRRFREAGEILLGLVDALGHGALQPEARLPRLAVAGGTGCEIAPQHQLRMAVALLGSGTKPALGGRAIGGDLMTAAMKRAERK